MFQICLRLLNISYKIKEILDDSFIAFLFSFDKSSDFLINIAYNNDTCQRNLISKSIQNSSYLYINSEILLNAFKECSNGNIFINIKKVDNKNVVMHFKIIEKECISMIKKNSLNYGFITSKTIYQYYYMEIFKEEEGEIMLHNKRFYGELNVKIVEKNEIKELSDSSIYPKENITDDNLNMIKYNPHILKLKYDYNNTSKCINGCYILITYNQKKSEGNYPIIGYEFTLLSHSWNYSNYISQIIDIPFNEYILGSFESDSITHHYYSISIPDDTEKIIIQIESNYIDAFYGEGRRKINTKKIRKNDNNLEIINNQNVIILNKSQINSKNKIISLAFRPKDYLSDIFSFYYFRILYVQKIYPIDSQLGNLCLPEYNNKTNLFYCYLIFSNKYDKLKTIFSISSIKCR